MLAGRYEVLEKIGQGAVGELLHTRDLWQDSRHVALKRVTSPVTSEKAAALAAEFALLRGIVHPHIVRAFDFGRLPDGCPYLTTEYIAGPRLLERWPRLSHPTRIALLLDLCRALQAVHLSGYVHGDLKPANVLLQSRPGPLIKLVDFGAAVRIGSRSRLMRGTPGYVAREVRTGCPADVRSDLYALGVMLRDCLPLKRVPHLRRLTEALTAERPAERPANIAAVIRVLASEHVAPLRPRLLRVPFLGRGAQLARLEREFARVRETGEVRSVLLTGGGRTRLLDELKTRCQLQGGLMLTTRRPALGELFERLVAALPPTERMIADAGRELLKIAPRLVTRPEFAALARRGEPASAPLPPKQERTRRWDRLAAFVARQARRRPLILAIRADGVRELQALAESLRRRDRAVPVLLCLAGEPGEFRADVLCDLPPLSGTQMRHLVRTALTTAVTSPLPAEVVGRIAALAGGDPGTALDFIAALPAEPRVETLPQLTDRTRTAHNQLRGLDPAALDLLLLLALAGEPLEDRALRSAYRRQRRRPPAARILATLLAAGFVRAAGPRAWEVADPHHGRAVIALAAATGKRTAHRALAAAFARGAARAPQWAAVARHALAAGDRERGVRAALRAGEAFGALHAYREAEELLQLAEPAALRRGGRPKLAIALLLLRAEVAMRTGRREIEEQVLRRLSVPSRRAHLTAAECARCARRQGVLAMLRGKHAQAARNLRRAARQLQDHNGRPRRGEGAGAERLRIAATRAMLKIHQGESAAALAICEDALADTGAHRRKRSAELAALLNYTAIAQLYCGAPERALASWDAARAAYRRAKQPAGESGILNNLGKFHMDRGDLRRARPALREALARRRQLADIDGVAETLTNLGIVEIMAGRLRRSARLLAIALRLRRRAGDRFGEMLTRANLAEVAALTGNYPAAEAGLRAALEFMRGAGHVRLVRGLEISLAGVWLAQGRTGTAERVLKRILEGGCDRLQAGMVRHTLGLAALARGGLPSAAAHLAAAEEIFTQLPHTYHRGLSLAGRIRAVDEERAARIATLGDIAAEIGSHTLAAWCDLFRGEALASAEIFSSETLARAAAFFDDAYRRARAMRHAELLWRVPLAHARLWRRAGRLRRAHDHLQEALGHLAQLQASLPTQRLRERYLKRGPGAAVQREIESLARAAGLEAGES